MSMPSNMADVRAEVVAGVLLQQAGKVLLLQQKKPSAYGLWSFPGGHVEEGETFEQTAIREAREESGYEVAIDHELLVMHHAPAKPVIHTFAGHISGGELQFPEHEILDAQWFTPAEIRAMQGQLRGPHIVLALEAAGL